jgi:hypothetical protein
LKRQFAISAGEERKVTTRSIGRPRLICSSLSSIELLGLEICTYLILPCLPNKAGDFMLIPLPFSVNASRPNIIFIVTYCTLKLVTTLATHGGVYIGLSGLLTRAAVGKLDWEIQLTSRRTTSYLNRMDTTS